MNNLDLPYERYKQFGPQNLTDSDLLAIIIRTGNEKNSVFKIVDSILNLASVKNDGLSALFNITEKQLCRIDGIGKIKASQIVCMIEFAKRLYISKASLGLSFDTAPKIAEYYMFRFKNLMQERITIIYLNTKLKMIADETLFVGTVNSSLISPREVFIKALNNNAVYIIILHNHPSGDSSPSLEDKKITLQLKSCGEMLNIPLLDHIIIGDSNYFSMKENGLI
ncbi:MAG: DNA repair protein RadC [Lachnospiraceae bacterium]|nr:DNA repair protein RadC [Lachnospiraceae bacterium]